jgi:hypothetical protein
MFNVFFLCGLLFLTEVGERLNEYPRTLLLYDFLEVFLRNHLPILNTLTLLPFALPLL